MRNEDRSGPIFEPATPYIRTLGEAGIFASRDTLGGKPLFGPGKPLALAAYLAHLPERTASREQLIDLIWSDLPVDAARHALRSAVWNMRKRFADTLILTDNQQVRLVASVRSDRDDFIEAVERIDLERAVELYRGHFLEGVGSLGGADFDHWVDGERYRLSLLLRRTAEVAIQSRLAVGNTRQAVAIAESVRRLDPDDQVLVRLVIETKLADGAVVSARVESEALTQLLGRSHRRADPATERVLKVARHLRTPASPPTHPEETDLIGRSEEIKALAAKWASVENGSHQTVWVTAGPGLGKTRLLDVFHNTLTAAGSNSILVKTPAAQSGVPFGAVADLAGQLGSCPGAPGVSPATAGVLLGLNPSLSGLFHGAPDYAPAKDRLRRRIAAVYELVLAVAHESPLALLLDDFDRWDDTSRRIFEALRPKLESHPVLVVMTAHSGTTGVGAVNEMALPPLLPVQVGELMGYQDQSPIAVQEIAKASGGAPGEVHRLLSELHGAGLLERRGDRWTCPDPAQLRSQLASTTPSPSAERTTWHAILDRRSLFLLLAGAVAGFFLALLTIG